MRRRPPRSTQSRSSAASDVYKRQLPSPIVEEGDEGAALVQREGIEHAFLHLAEEIKKGRSIRVETVSRTGDAGAQLMAAANLISPELIVIASQRHHLITSLMLGSVSRKLVREGCWPMP